MPSHFIISLDLELHWGVHDKRSIDDYRANLDGTRHAVTRMLSLFAEHDVAATWATVGMLFADGPGAAREFAPATMPGYEGTRFDSYRLVEDNMAGDYYFAPEMIAEIAAVDAQEIATHTYSHYYCLEQPRRDAALRADLRACAAIAGRIGIELKSIVFPRNQYDDAALRVCFEEGILAYRGQPKHPFYDPRTDESQGLHIRAGRLLDAYAPIARFDTLPELSSGRPVNVPATRFMRPWSPSVALFEGLRVRRILAEMRHAARSGQDYHLWWHPHNFGTHTDQNIDALREVLAHFTLLRSMYGMQSTTMGSRAELVRAEAAA